MMVAAALPNTTAVPDSTVLLAVPSSYWMAPLDKSPKGPITPAFFRLGLAALSF
jgi:hypothetical protein